MKKMIVLLAIVSLVMFGCASVKFNSDTGDIEYSRIGDQQIQSFEIETIENGYRVKFKGQQSSGDALSDALELLRVLTISGAL